MYETDPANDPISLKKLKRLEGAWMVRKDILGWTFDGKNKTMELEKDKLDKLMSMTKSALKAIRGILFKDLYSMTGKMRNASQGVPGTEGCFSPFNRILVYKPSRVWFLEKSELTEALKDWRVIFNLALTRPTHVHQLVPGNPEVAGIVDASKEGVGGLVFGITHECVPTVFRMEWPKEVRDQLQTEENPDGTITNSNLEMAGLVLISQLNLTVN